MMVKSDAAFDEAGTLGFEQPALQAGKGLADGDPAAGGHNAVPGNSLTPRASGHCATGGASSAGEPRGPGDLSICKDVTFGDTLDQRINFVPVGIHVSKDSWNSRALPVIRTRPMPG